MTDKAKQKAEELVENSREKDIIELCKHVLNMFPDHWDNPNGGYESTCPMCFARKISNDFVDIHEIKHDINCGYLIAKDLSANILSNNT